MPLMCRGHSLVPGCNYREGQHGPFNWKQEFVEGKSTQANCSGSSCYWITSVSDIKGSQIGFIGWSKEEVFTEKGIKKHTAISQSVKGEILATKLDPISSISSLSSSHLAANLKLLSPLLIASSISESSINDLVLRLLNSVNMSIIRSELNQACAHLHNAHKHFKASK